MTRKTSDILDENTQRTTGRTALESNIEAAKAVSDIVKTTLGPMGMDKMLIDELGNTVITNDGVKILQEMEIEHPGAKLLVDVAKTQESEVGDGTTTAVILCGELLAQAQILIRKKIHPTTITRTYKQLSMIALKILENESVKVDTDNQKLINDICFTAMTGKVAEFSKEKLAEIIYDAVSRVKENNKVPLNRIKVQKATGGEISDSSIVDGLVLDRDLANVNMPKSIDNSRVLLVNFPLEVRELDTDAKVNLSSLQEYEEFMKNEENYLREIVVQIKASGANVVICQKGIDDNVAYYMAKEGILGIRRCRKSDMEKLSFALNCPIISNLENVSRENLGKAKNVCVKEILNENYIFVTGCINPKIITLFLKASTSHVLDEIERATFDAIGDINSILQSERIVAGGGAIELELYRQLLDHSKKMIGKEQIIAQAYAESFLTIPKILCENSGFDEIENITKLISNHEKKLSKSGLDSFVGIVEDTIKRGIVEPINIKSQAIKSATESSSMILRIDDIIATKRLRDRDVNLDE